jgi:hypothetical protein
MRPNRLGLYVPWAVFLLICAGWCAYWFVAKDAAIRALASGAARVEAAGGTASYAGVRASGFPLRLTLTLDDARFAPTPALAFEAARLPVSVNLTNPRHIIVGLADGFSWTTGDGARHTMTMRRGDMSLRLGPNNALARASLDLQGASVSHGWPTGVQFPEPLPPITTTIGALLVHVRPDPRSAADAQIIIDATDWQGLTPFAALNDLGPFGHFRTAVVATESASLVSRTPLRTWTGSLRIERFDVAYSDAAVTGDGVLTLDAAHRPDGVLRFTPAGIPAPVELRASDGWWTLAGLRVAAARPLYSD